jgi:HlyD family secretion protein
VTPLAPAVPRRPGRRGRSVALWSTLVVVIAGLAVLWLRGRSAQAVRYVTVPVTRGTIARSVTASGAVNPVTTVQVGTYVSGVVQELRCDYNTHVTKGQLCAKIDPRPYQVVVDQDQANLSSAQAQLAKDQTNLAYAKLTYERAVDLHNRAIDSQDALDSAKSAYDQAQAQTAVDLSTIAQHQAELNAAKINLGYTDIVSPVNGTVVSRDVTVGQTVAASFQTPTLFLIATDLAEMQVDANVSESDIGGVREGQDASFGVEAFPNRVFNGHVVQVRQAPQTVQNVVTYDVVVSAPNADFVLKPGMTATVRLVIDHRDNVLRVPDQALRYAPGGLHPGDTGPAAGPATGPAQIWVLRNGAPVRVPITVGLDDDTQVEIVKGDVAVGDQVIVSEQPGGSSSNESAARFFRL